MMTLLSRRGDSNTRPLRPERSALPTALLLDFARKISIILQAKIFSLTLFASIICRSKFTRFCKSGCKGTAFF